MGGKGGSKEVYDFLFSLDYGICHGPLDSLNEIVIKDKPAFTGPVTTSSTLRIDKPKLFGGDEAEGGPVGDVEFYVGDYDQAMSDWLAGSVGLTPSTAPGYRGLAHLFFRGRTTDKTAPGYADLIQNGKIAGFFSGLFGGQGRGFRWSSNNPYLPPAKVCVTRSPKNAEGTAPALTTSALVYPIVGVDGNGEYEIALPGDAFTAEGLDRTRLPDANPAAFLYELMTNADWGKGEPESALDKGSYEGCAQALLDEHFGISFKYTRQETHEKIAQEVLDHIKAVQFQDPATGLWTLKLIRDDYDAATALLLDPTNCTAQNIKTRLWGETINQITASYTDPVSEKSESVIAQNPANIAIQGGVTNDDRDYYAVRNPYLAKFLAERDVAEASRTLTSATIYADGLARKIVPGDVIRFTWPEEQIAEMVCRVQKIDYGSSKDRRVKLEVVEDVFATPVYSGAVATQPALGQVTDPAPKDADQVFVMTPPLPPLLANGVDPDDLDANYPASYAMFLISDSAVPFIDVEARADVTTGNGGVSQQEVATFRPANTATLGVALTPEVSSVLPGDLVMLLTSNDPEGGDLLVIGSSDDSHEIVMLDTYDEVADEWTVIRGVYDTVPETWEASDLVWQLLAVPSTLDRQERAAGAPVDYQFLPRTRLGQLDLGAATVHEFTPSERPHAPFRPANAQIEGNGFAETQYLAGTAPTTITLTWADRNRLGEDAVAARWDDLAAAPEAGQTTTIRFRSRLSGELEHEETGLTGGTFDFELNNISTFRFYDVEFVAVRDGVESFRAATAGLEIERLGYGNNYGFDYGENDGDV